MATILQSPGAELRQQIYGVKVRVANDLIYSRWPQLSVGVQHKRNVAFAIPAAVGARDDEGTDLYVAATKAFLAGVAGRNFVANATLRATKANQTGLLGFGGDRGDGYQLCPELSALLFLNRSVVVGAEYRVKPDNLSFSAEDDWNDVFAGYFPNKNVGVVVAYAQLGTIATLKHQSGIYLSVQVSF